jgi:hypothetical protein
MAFPTTGVLDSFNRADEGPPMTGWTTGYKGGTNGLKVVSNQCQGNVLTAMNDGWWNAQQYGPDCEAYFTVITKPLAGDQLEIYGRLQTPGSAAVDGYLARILANAGIGARCQLYRVDNGVATSIATEVSGLPDIASGDLYGLEIIGSTINLYRNIGGAGWNLKMTATDATYTGAGYLGAGIWNSNTATIDDFGGGTAVTAVQVILPSWPRVRYTG